MKKLDTFFRSLSCITMMAALLWLSVCTPFVYAADKMVTTEAEHECGGADENIPPAGTTEEKSESSTNSLSEYLNELLNESSSFIIIIKSFNRGDDADIVAFRPEMVCPPPEHKI